MELTTDLRGRTQVAGLYALGEVACTGLHGANRLASNSLLEGLVFADRVARALAETPARSSAGPVPGEGETDVPSPPESEAMRVEMRAVMSANVGVVRTEASLLQAEQVLAALIARTPADDWRTRNQLLVATLITQAARRRRESRGGHRRADYPPKARKTGAR